MSGPRKMEKLELEAYAKARANESPAGDAPPISGEADADALRTRLARKFVSLADSVTESFRDFAIGAGAWAIELTAPQGMSTGGGKQALQHLRLRPRRQGYSVLVGGTVNQVERRAELRDDEHITTMHEVRLRSALEISRQEWEQFLRKAEVVLNGAGDPIAADAASARAARAAKEHGSRVEERGRRARPRALARAGRALARRCRPPERVTAHSRAAHRPGAGWGCVRGRPRRRDQVA